MNYRKYSFFFRTADQYVGLKKYAQNLAEAAETKYNIPNRGAFAPSRILLTSTAWNISAIQKKIPKRRPTKKKYIATIAIDEYYANIIKEDVVADILALGLEQANTEPNTPKYSEDELTREPFRVKHYEHYRKLVKALNKEYGPDNWHLRGARKVVKKLRQAEHIRAGVALTLGENHELKKIAKEGIQLDVVVTDKVDNLKPLLFKVQLMG